MCVYFQQNKKRPRPRKGKMSHKSYDQSNEAKERRKDTVNMYHLGRKQRKKYKGRS